MRLFNPLTKDIKGVVWNGTTINIPSQGYSKNLDIEACNFVKRIFNALQIVGDEGDKPVQKVVNDTPEVGLPPRETEMAPQEESIEELNAQYFTKFGKKLVGKWAKNIDYIKSKLNK